MLQSSISAEEFNNRRVTALNIINEVKKVVKGKDEIIKKVMLAILSGGHILLEDIPGVGKTTMAIAFSNAMRLQYNRVQFTPDVMPSDVTGYTIYRKESDQFEYVKGAALCNLFLADEINRTSSKTQSALLEVMEEGKVTVDMKTYEAPKPFTVIATQNPVGHAGTQMLPESQLDRFLVKLSMGYPDKKSELEILKSKKDDHPAVTPVISASGLLLLQEAVNDIFLHDEVYEYIVSLVAMTRENDFVELGASPRGAIALMKLSKANAFLHGRDYVLPDDIDDVLVCTLSHRLILRPKARVSGISTESVLNTIKNAVKKPTVKV